MSNCGKYIFHLSPMIQSAHIHHPKDQPKVKFRSFKTHFLCIGKFAYNRGLFSIFNCVILTNYNIWRDVKFVPSLSIFASLFKPLSLSKRSLMQTIIYHIIFPQRRNLSRCPLCTLQILTIFALNFVFARLMSFRLNYESCPES